MLRDLWIGIWTLLLILLLHTMFRFAANDCWSMAEYKIRFFSDSFVEFFRAGSILEVRLSIGDGAISQTFKFLESKIPLQGSIDRASNDWKMSCSSWENEQNKWIRILPRGSYHSQIDASNQRQSLSISEASNTLTVSSCRHSSPARHFS